MAGSARSGTDPRVVGVISGAILIVVALVIVGLLTAGGDGDAVGVQGGLTATPLTSASPAEDMEDVPDPVQEAAAATSAPAPEPSAPDDPTDSQNTPAGQGQREPTDADADAFADMVAPSSDRRVIHVDLDGDGSDELLVASIQGSRSRIDLAVWDGRHYQLAASGDGGAADRLDAILWPDLDGDPTTHEVAVAQRSGTMGESLSLWSATPDRVTPLPAIGGCWDGSHTYGIIGASVVGSTISATCDGSPAPTIAWPSDLYRWNDTVGGMEYTETLGESTN